MRQFQVTFGRNVYWRLQCFHCCLQNNLKRENSFQISKMELRQTNAQFLELILDWPRRTGRGRHKGRVSVIEPDTMAGPRRQTNEPEAEATGRGGRAGTAGRCLDKAQKLHIPLTSCRARIRRNDDPRRPRHSPTTHCTAPRRNRVTLPRPNESLGKLTTNSFTTWSQVAANFSWHFKVKSVEKQKSSCRREIVISHVKPTYWYWSLNLK